MSRFGGNREPRPKSVVGLVLLAAVLLFSAGDLFSQSSSPISSGPAGPSGKPWKDNPYGIKVTRWPEQSPIRPITYAQWSAKQTAPAAPFSATLVEKRLPDNPAKSRGTVCVIINSGIYPGLEEAIGGYITDLARDGYAVEMHAITGGTAQDVRSFLAARHTAGIDGAVLIGDFPVAWYKTYCWDPIEEEQFPCDLYYMDLDGIWTDTGIDGIFETHTGATAPDIWLGRLTASPLTMTGQTETQLLQNYFIKNHLYRTGSLPVNDQALVYIDDDWSSGSDWESYCVGLTYADRTVVADDYTTVADDYAQRLRQYYELVEVWVHSDPLKHYFKIPPDVWSTTLGVGEMVGIDPPGVFYNLFACSNARYVEANYMGGWYIFRSSAGLAAVGSAKTGSMLNFDAFYQPLGSGSNIGEAFFDWFTSIIQYGVEDWEYCWFYGMTLCGDPTLMPHLSSCPRITEKSESDAAFGDGDGLYEPGETIECRVTVANNGATAA
ncbi:MAG: hypothetical protein PHR28_13990, partial [candidate division Zixibacteria bacterium]|nr:hypothetical protein [candidate division Zixibacteria bacterium]